VKKIIGSIFVLFISLMTFSCTNQTIFYDVYVTVYPIQYVVEEIFKGTTLTVGIVPGVSSHQDSIDWSPKEIIAMTEASYLFYVGANYDQYVDFQINSIFTNKPVELVKIEDETSYIQFIEGVVHVHEDEVTTESEVNLLGNDPHFWISPLKVQQVATLVYDKLILKYPDIKDLMKANYDQLILNLQTLSDSFKEVIDQSEKTILTSTNLYGYLAYDYGLLYLSISPGYHEESEQFTTQEKEEIVAEAILHEIQYIIYERNTTSPLSNAVFTTLENLGYNPIKLEYDILQSLTNDEKAEGKDYITVMYTNLELLKLATGYIE